MQTDSNQQQDIIQLLNEGSVSFTYETISGETRNAIGTTNADLIPEGQRSVVANAGDNVSYFDTNVNDWRTFKMSRLDQSSIRQN